MTSNRTPADHVLFLGKRYYTNKDALEERFGRIFHLPDEWSRRRAVRLWLVDYHGREAIRRRIGSLEVESTPVASLAMLRMAFGVLRRRPRILVASGDCYIGLLGWLLARLSGARFVFDIYDKYDEFAGYRRPLGLDLFGFLRRRADLLLFASPALAERLCPEAGPGSVAVVPNGVSAQMFHAIDPARARAELGLEPGPALVGYFGAMEPDRGVGDLIEAIAIARQGGEDLRLLVCGRQHPDTPLDQAWILYQGMVPHERMPLYLNAADVLVVPYRLSDFMDMGASCKIAEYLACERPLVSTRTPNLLANFPEQAAQLGPALCRPQDPEDMARSILHQLRHRVVAALPQKMMWPAIAEDALAAIEGAPQA
jgi:glycosyltransferase involved in cell wall biosynthesis